MLHTLYLLFIAPLEFLMRLVLEWGFSWTHSWGWSLVLLSLVVNTAILPIYNWAERRQEEERALRRKMARHEAMLRECFTGQERFALVSALRRLRGYTWLHTLRASVGLLLQIPFFFAAYYLLSGFTPLHGRSFVLLSDLGAPDALLSLGGFSLNVLPIVMTGINLFSAFFYTHNLTRRDQAQIYAMALIFLVLLYNAASALTLYWTLNNLYSLGKNIVEKDWMRLPNALKFLERWENAKRSLADRAAVVKADIKQAGSCIGVGALFWLYTCTGALDKREGMLDVAFKSAIGALAVQCFFTALAASFVLAYLGLLRISSYSRRLWPFPTVLACASILFLFQSTFFISGLEIEQGRFRFDMWNEAGFLCFLCWALCMFGIVKYRNGAPARARRATKKSLGVSSKLDAETAMQPAPSIRGTLALACLMGGFCGLFLWVFMPFCTYFHNPNEFAFNGRELLRAVAPWCLLTIVVATLAFWASTCVLPCGSVRLPWGDRNVVIGKVTAVHVFVLTLLGLLWLEGTILSYGLPQLDGKQNIFNSPIRSVFDTAVWCGILLLVFRCKIITNTNLYIYFLFILIFSVTALLDSFYKRSEKIDARTFQGQRELRIVDKETLYSQLRFSSNSNIIVILVDSLDTLAFEKTIETYPELKKILQGFTIYRENLGAGGLTPQSLPQILSGRIYRKERDGAFGAFVQNALLGEFSMAGDAVRSGRKVYIDAASWYVINSDEIQYNSDTNNNHSLSIEDIYKFYFKFIPYVTKHYVYKKFKFDGDSYKMIKKNNVNNKYIIEGDDANKQTFNNLIENLGTFIDEPVFQFIYFFGVHVPYTKENIIETTKEFINDFGKFTDALKETGIYDKTTFVIMADHGVFDHRHFYPERKGTYPTILFPVLMVKTKDAVEYQVSDSLTSSVYVRKLINDFYLNGDNRQELMNFNNNLPSTRMIYRPGLGTFVASGTFSSLKLARINEDLNIRLKNNIIYTFNEKDKKIEYAHHKVDLVDVDDSNIILQSFGGFSLRNINKFKVKASFPCEAAPGTRQNVFFSISSYTGKGKIDIYDEVSGNVVHLEKNGIIGINCTVDNDGYINLIFSPVVKQANIIHYMTIQDEGRPMPQFPAIPQ